MATSQTYGDQEGTAYNGHFACTCYHPLFVFTSSGIWNAARYEVLEPVVARYRGKFKRSRFRADAAFANREAYEFLEAEGFTYAIRFFNRGLGTCSSALLVVT
jgi:hypothetical protein